MAAKKLYYALGTAALIYLLLKPTKMLAKITDENKHRECDNHGCGHFGASRGSRDHKGVDIVTVPGQAILSPITGKVVRIAYPYASDLSYKGLLLENDKYVVKIFYINPTIAIGSQVTAGQKIAEAQDIAAKYSPGMTNHAHIEVYDKQGNLLNPTNLFT